MQSGYGQFTGARPFRTAEAFSEQYEDKNLPVVVTDWTAGWAAHQNWSVDRLANDHNDVRFEVRTG